MALQKISLRKAGHNYQYRVTVEEARSDNDLDNSLSPSVDEVVEEITVPRNECDREDGVNYQEATQCLGK